MTVARADTYALKVQGVRALETQMNEWTAKVSVRFLRNYTIESIEPLLRFECARSRIAADVSFSDFDTFQQEVLDPSSATRTGSYDLVVLSLWLDPEPVFDRVRTLLDELAAGLRSTIAVTTFLPPVYAAGTARIGHARCSMTDSVAMLNERLAAYARSQNRVHVIDLQRLAIRLGERGAVDPRFWYLYRAPLKNEMLDLIAAELAGIVAATAGAAKKVLALDCDNTLWGGIVGEDGLDGIALDPGSFPGSAFYDFHRQILELKQQGIILALCSRNNEADVLAVLDGHPSCLLRKSDFAAWRIDWRDKSANLRELAGVLNVGLDAFVFVDDDSQQCAAVRTMLPSVEVLQVPARIFDLPGLLRAYRGFDRVGRSAEDARRTEMYQQQTRRDAARQAAGDLQSYLASLQLTAVVRQAQASDATRVAQLTQKTNQFNLTTRRYSEADIRRLIDSPDHLVMTMRARDRFGDYGLSAVCIVRFEEQTAVIDTLLMSCRVLGRELEFALLRRVVGEAFNRRSRAITGEFVPTNRNQQTADFYLRAGFRAIDGASTPGRRYVLQSGAELTRVPDFVSMEA
jgi:FkbH-like protein